MSTIYEVRDLVVDLFTRDGAVRPVDGVSYAVAPGECLGIVGESGSGKTVSSFAPLGLMPPGVAVDISGSARFDGTELATARGSAVAALRGREIGAIFQDPMTALNPARRIGRQVAEVCELHQGLSRRAAEARALDLLKLAGVTDPELRLRQYPHELSGGLCQRVMIAIAVAAEPRLLIADEPTTALDVTVQSQILDLLRDLRARLGMAMILITHDIGVVAGSADRVAVMYAGRLVETGPVEEVLTAPRHPYTQALVAAIPRPDDAIGSPFRGLKGMPPALTDPIPGCPFAPRCIHAFATCWTIQPALLPSGPVRDACHLLNEEALT